MFVNSFSRELDISKLVWKNYLQTTGLRQSPHMPAMSQIISWNLLGYANAFRGSDESPNARFIISKGAFQSMAKQTPLKVPHVGWTGIEDTNRTNELLRVWTTVIAFISYIHIICRQIQIPQLQVLLTVI